MVDLQRSIVAYGISIAAGCKRVQQIVMQAQCRPHFEVKNSLCWIRARILFVQIFDK
jgi:hypothetical protein